MRIIVLANTVHTNTLTGGDRIFAECVKYWIAWKYTTSIVTNEVGSMFCLALGVPPYSITTWSASWSDRGGVYIAMTVKAILSIMRGVPYALRKVDIIFASSFFVPDLLPAFFLKLTNPRATFAAACYLFSTQSWGQDYTGGRLKGLLFYLNEQIAFFLLKNWGGVVLTASEFDRTQFIKSQRFPYHRVHALRGGVDTKFFLSVVKPRLKYEAIFVGRFHPQKCIDELLEIWKTIVGDNPTWKLALVGSGPLENTLKMLVRRLKLTKNVAFLGVLDGVAKTKILKSSRVFVSASRFDSGNIALDEAMGCGLPGVVYDLPRLHYPSGVIKVPVGDQKSFAHEVSVLLRDEVKRKKMGDDALAFSYTLDWEKKAEELLTFLRPKNS